MNCHEKNLYWQDVHLECEEENVLPVIYDQMVEPFLDEIEQGWLAEHSGAIPAEERIKNYLSHVASLMIRRPEDYGVKSERTLRKIAQKEIPCADLGIGAAPVPPPKVLKKPQKRECMYDKIARIKKEHPGATFTWITVDVNGDFEYEGHRLRVVDKRYAGRRAKGFSGLYYDFDKVWAVSWPEGNGRVTRYYTQRVDEIPPERIFGIRERIG